MLQKLVLDALIAMLNPHVRTTANAGTGTFLITINCLNFIDLSTNIDISLLLTIGSFFFEHLDSAFWLFLD